MSMVVYHLQGKTGSLSICANGNYDSVKMPGGKFCSDWPFTCTKKENTFTCTKICLMIYILTKFLKYFG